MPAPDRASLMILSAAVLHHVSADASWGAGRSLQLSFSWLSGRSCSGVALGVVVGPRDADSRAAVPGWVALAACLSPSPPPVRITGWGGPRRHWAALWTATRWPSLSDGGDGAGVPPVRLRAPPGAPRAPPGVHSHRASPERRFAPLEPPGVTPSPPMPPARPRQVLLSGRVEGGGRRRAPTATQRPRMAADGAAGAA